MSTQISSTSVLDKSLIPLRLTHKPLTNTDLQLQIEIALSLAVLYDTGSTMWNYHLGQLKMLLWFLYDIDHSQALDMAGKAIEEARANV